MRLLLDRSIVSVANIVNMFSRMNTQQVNNNVIVSSYSLEPNTVNSNGSFNNIH